VILAENETVFGNVNGVTADTPAHQFQRHFHFSRRSRYDRIACTTQEAKADRLIKLFVAGRLGRNARGFCWPKFGWEHVCPRATVSRVLVAAPLPPGRGRWPLGRVGVVVLRPWPEEWQWLKLKRTPQIFLACHSILPHRGNVFCS